MKKLSALKQLQDVKFLNQLDTETLLKVAAFLSSEIRKHKSSSRISSKAA